MNIFSNKIYLSIFILVIFFLLYTTVPNYEFNNTSNEISLLDKLYYAISIHTGLKNDLKINPISSRSKVLSMFHMILSYSILLM